MRIVVKKIGQKPEVREINGELHEMQEIVGGYIEAFNMFDNVLCICDEEGKLKNYKPNFLFGGDVIVGDVFFVAAGEEDFESLNENQIAILMNMFDMLE